MFRRALLAIAAFPVLYCLAAFVLAFVPGARSDVEFDDEQVTIYLVRGPIHYDFLLPLDDQTTTRFDWLRRGGVALDNPDAEWLVVGWGGQEFYTTVGSYADVEMRAVWRGITGDNSVIRVSLAGPVSPDWPIKAMSLSGTQYANLMAYIEGSFAGGRETLALNEAGFSDFDRFFPAKGRFHLFNTCNVWIGRALRAAGVRFGIWTPAPFSVTLSARFLAD
ncbi:MAG: TIGR02117 family protein [Paracoccaceae bacterium]